MSDRSRGRGPQYRESIERGLTVFEPLVILRPENVYIDPTARIDSFVKIEGGDVCVIGQHVHIASYCHLNIGGGSLFLAAGSACASGVRIVTGSNIAAPGRSCSAVAPGNVVRKSFVRVERNAVIYVGATICPGVTIGEGAIILPGAVVRCDIPAGETWGGVPARRIRASDGLTDEQRFVASYAELYDGDHRVRGA